MIERLAKKTLPQKLSYFIFGPRQTGKTTLLGTIDHVLKIDLLSTEEFFNYNRNPDLLYKQLKLNKKQSGTVWVDEVQKIPLLLDVVHKCIEEFPQVKFILSGSSTRKLRRGAANLLGGRAAIVNLYSLCFFEIENNFDLDFAITYGNLPKIYTLGKLENDFISVRQLLKSYVITYLNDEIKAEALVRNLTGFQRFLEIAGSQFAQEINFSAIADESQLTDDTVKEYFSILEDTLIGYFLYPYSKSTRERLSKSPKFYFFDNGVTRAISNLEGDKPSNQERGRLFEQYIFQELIKINEYFNKNLKFSLWRTYTGIEVDFLVEHQGKVLFAIECKSSKVITKRDFSALICFGKSFSKTRLIVCAPVKEEFKDEKEIEVLSPESVFKLIRDL